MQRILIVDDYETLREIMQGIIRDEGYEVVAVDDQEALRILERGESFDLIISDIDMIAIRGDELVKRFKEKYPLMRALLVSGGMRPAGDRADRFLGKPFSLEVFRKTVRDTLRCNT